VSSPCHRDSPVSSTVHSAPWPFTKKPHTDTTGFSADLMPLHNIPLPPPGQTSRSLGAANSSPRFQGRAGHCSVIPTCLECRTDTTCSSIVHGHLSLEPLSRAAKPKNTARARDCDSSSLAHRSRPRLCIPQDQRGCAPSPINPRRPSSSVPSGVLPLSRSSTCHADTPLFHFPPLSPYQPAPLRC
jgi:hypothetical protein